jgi:sporulation protein YlmC with PRC-barrel domain
MRSSFILAIGTASLMSSIAFAQTVQPNSGPTASTVTATTTNLTTTKWMTEEATGQWRASKMIGLNVYNSVSEKIGTISELIVDQSGKLEAVVVGAGGFLGIGERDVAVPYSQIEWSYQPVASSGIGTPSTTGAASTASPNSENTRPYPDHALLNMSADQLKAAPGFKFSPADDAGKLTG